MSNGAGKFSPFSQIQQVELQRSLKKSKHSHERYRSKTQRLPRFLLEYRGEVPGCPGGVGAYATHDETAQEGGVDPPHIEILPRPSVSQHAALTTRGNQYSDRMSSGADESMA